MAVWMFIIFALLFSAVIRGARKTRSTFRPGYKFADTSK